MARTLPKFVDFPDPRAADLKALGALIRNRRGQSQLRITDAAGVMDISPDMLSRIENGRPIGADKLFQILDGLGLQLLVVTPDEAEDALKFLRPSETLKPKNVR
jgi:transcriptional regulator with XRE-family HTH domain